MAREEKATKDRTCIVCKSTINTTASGIKEHFKLCIERLVAQAKAKGVVA
jgi:hypothetical protein